MNNRTASESVIPRRFHLWTDRLRCEAAAIFVTIVVSCYHYGQYSSVSQMVVIDIEGTFTSHWKVSFDVETMSRELASLLRR